MKKATPVDDRRAQRKDEPYKRREKIVEDDKIILEGVHFILTMNRASNDVIIKEVNGNTVHYSNPRMLQSLFPKDGSVAFGIGTWASEPYKSDLQTLISRLIAKLPQV